MDNTSSHKETITHKNITDALAKGRILILDGAMGTMLQRLGLGEDDFRWGALRRHGRELKGDNECLNLTRPDAIRQIHEQYIAAGADIIETNTFGANSVAQAEYGLGGMAAAMAREGARLAREAADEAFRRTGRQVFVAGSIGPTSKSLSLSPVIDDPAARAVSFDEMAEAYSGQIRGWRHASTRSTPKPPFTPSNACLTTRISCRIKASPAGLRPTDASPLSYRPR